MENRNIPSFLMEELRFYGLENSPVTLIQDKDGVITARVFQRDETMILKCFEREEFRREIENYRILESCDIPVLKVLKKNDRSLLLEDLNASSSWRTGCAEDTEDPAVIQAIAAWYRTLHENGRSYAETYGADMYEEWDYFTRDNLMKIEKKFRFGESEGFQLIKDSFDVLRKKMDEAPRTLAYNDFYYTNMAVKKDRSEALMFDYNLLGRGCAVSDLRNIAYWLNEENRKVFFSAYGEVSEELVLLDQIVTPAVTLCLAAQRDCFPSWAEEAVRGLETVPALIERLEAM